MEAKRIARPYELFARVYDPQSRILPFLDTLGELYGLKISSILDLACGTGALIRELIDSGKTEHAVGLDISVHMLHIARQKLRDVGNVRLIEGDFRAFSLGEKFDTIFCIYDSLNYIDRESELDLVFGCVRKHLKSPGFFVFDVINENHCLWTDGFSREYEGKGIKWKSWNVYESSTKKIKTFLEFEDGIEVHEQIPLECDTIARATENAGLTVVSAFSNRKRDPVDDSAKRLHFVLGN